MRIYFLFFKYAGSSLAASAVDLGLFTVFVSLLRNVAPGKYILLSTALARVLSAGTNYMVNSRLVFGKRISPASGFAYFLLCTVQMAVSAGLVTLLFGATRWPESLCKVIVDVMLFFVSFQIQHRWIFR